MTGHLLAGFLLGLAFVCIVLPLILALAGPDEDEDERLARHARELEIRREMDEPTTWRRWWW